jgi:hypothetical protein
MKSFCLVLLLIYIECKPISGRDKTYFRARHIFTAPSPHLRRTFAVPSSLHACIRLASSLHKVCSASTAESRSTCGKYAGLLYVDFAESRVLVPALERRKSEQGAKEERRRSDKKTRENPFYRTKTLLSQYPDV